LVNKWDKSCYRVREQVFRGRNDGNRGGGGGRRRTGNGPGTRLVRPGRPARLRLLGRLRPAPGPALRAPAPYGGPFLAEWQRYFGLAVYYDLLGVWLVSFPSSWSGWGCTIVHCPGVAGGAVAALHAVLLVAYLALSQIDHELLRFLGVRLNPSFLFAYAQPQMLSDTLFLDVLGSDRGGAFLSLILLIFVPLALCLVGHPSPAPARQRRQDAGLVVAILLASGPARRAGERLADGDQPVPAAQGRAVILAFATDMATGYEDRRAPADLDRLVVDYRQAWLARSSDPNWRFPDPDFPYLRVPIARRRRPRARNGTSSTCSWNRCAAPMPASSVPTLRDRPRLLSTGWRTGRTPAAWTRTLSFGMPSINGIFATHCSITPPSQHYITTLTHVRFLCLPEMLRTRGYRTEMFNGGDTDWDNSSPWLRQWYDRLWRFPEAEGRDRDIFRAAAAEVRRLGRSGRPFLASIVSVSNHTPFRTQEPALDIAGQASAAERILNTTHYTDDVVGEFLASLRASHGWRGP
jgi:hypothetical protein